MKKIFAWLSVLLLSLSLCGSVNAKEKTSAAQGGGLDELEVHFIDVGQGDATLIKCGDAAMLIDAGENDKGTVVQNYIRKQGVTSLDYLIVTHPHSDHCGGADVIITKYDIDTIIMPNYAVDTATYRDVIKAMDDKRYKVTEPVVGDTYTLGDAEFTIIAPNADDYGDETNNYSVGILLKHGNKKFVFTGDAEEDAEADILENGIDLSADVLKVGHHGSKTSSSQEFLECVDPKYAVVSCGENNEYGHPHAATLNALRALGVKLFRTDEQGSLIATSNGRKITWNAAPTETWKAGEPTKSSAGTTSGKSKSGTAAGAAKDSGKQESGTQQAANEQQAVSQQQTESQQQAASVQQAGAAQQAENTQPKEDSAPAVEEPQQAAPQDTQGLTYVLNVKSKKFHRPSCGSLPTANRSDSTQSREEIIAQGYVPCKNCNP